MKGGKKRERDYPLEEDKYQYFTAKEMSMQGYYS